MDKFAFVFSGIASLATFLFGGWDLSLQIFLAFMIIDFITGLLHGFYNGELSSKVGYRGIIKKTGMLIVLIIANLLDALTGAPMFRIAVCYFFIATEGISILENLGKMGVPIPPVLLDKLAQLKDKGDSQKGTPKQ